MRGSVLMSRILGLSYVLLCIITFSRLSSGQLQCYMGYTSDGGSDVQNMTCSHTLTHDQGIMHGENVTYLPVNYSLHHPESKDRADIRFCSILKYSNKNKTDFMCDYNNICPSYVASPATNSTSIGAEIKGTRGTLFCCGGDLCNNPTVGAKLPASPRLLQCYSGNATLNNLKACSTKWCVTRIILAPVAGVQVSPYSCDRHNLCDTYNITSGSCKKVQDASSGTQKICCCSSDGCNQPQGGSTVPSVPFSSMAPPGDQSSNLRHWMFIGGVVAGIMLGILLFIVVAVVIRRCKQKRNDQLTYTYTQLTADLAENQETDDERMLVG